MAIFHKEFYLYHRYDIDQWAVLNSNGSGGFQIHILVMLILNTGNEVRAINVTNFEISYS